MNNKWFELLASQAIEIAEKKITIEVSMQM